jgi:hypothetical protein
MWPGSTLPPHQKRHLKGSDCKMRPPPDHNPANARELGGWTRKETKYVVAYKAEARAKRERERERESSPPFGSFLNEKMLATASDPSLGSGAATGL